MHVIVNHLLTSYESEGNGRVIVMLHGWGDNSATFNKLKEQLAQNFQVITMDLPGFGKSQASTSAWGLDDYADFVAAFLDKLQIKPYAFIGHSNGGAIAIRGLGTERLRTEKLILLSSAGIRDDYNGRKKIFRLVAKTAKILAVPLPKKLQQRLKSRAYRAIGSDLFVAEHLQETFKKIVTDDVRDDAAKILIPTLLVYGTDDNATPVRYGKTLSALINNSQLEIIDKAGHFVHHDQPLRVNELVQDFLKS